MASFNAALFNAARTNGCHGMVYPPVFPVSERWLRFLGTLIYRREAEESFPPIPAPAYLQYENECAIVTSGNGPPARFSSLEPAV